MSAITVVKLGIGLRIALRKPAILLLDVSLVVVAAAMVLVVAILVARMTIAVMVVDTTLVVVEGEMAILAHDVSLLHESWRPPDLVNPKSCRRMDKPSIGVLSVEKLQISLFLISCSQGILNSSCFPGIFPKDCLFTCIFHSL